MVVSQSPTSQLALGLTLCLVSVLAGYRLGTLARPKTTSTPRPENEALLDADESDAEEDAESISDGDLSSISAGFLERCKMVLVVRTDLKMTQGKIAAQCGHATLACYKALMKVNPSLVQHWERTGQAKIALKAKSEDQLLELEAIAKSLNLCARSIQDQGLTQVEEGTRTVLAIGPAPVNLINEVTGKLRLL